MVGGAGEKRVAQIIGNDAYPTPLHGVRIKDDEGKTQVFLTDNTDLPARTIIDALSRSN